MMGRGAGAALHLAGPRRSRSSATLRGPQAHDPRRPARRPHEAAPDGPRGRQDAAARRGGILHAYDRSGACNAAGRRRGLAAARALPRSRLDERRRASRSRARDPTSASTATTPRASWSRRARSAPAGCSTTTTPPAACLSALREANREAPVLGRHARRSCRRSRDAASRRAEARGARRLAWDEAGRLPEIACRAGTREQAGRRVLVVLHPAPAPIEPRRTARPRRRSGTRARRSRARAARRGGRSSRRIVERTGRSEPAPSPAAVCNAPERIVTREVCARRAAASWDLAAHRVRVVLGPRAGRRGSCACGPRRRRARLLDVAPRGEAPRPLPGPVMEAGDGVLLPRERLHLADDPAGGVPLEAEPLHPARRRAPASVGASYAERFDRVVGERALHHVLRRRHRRAP